ncbi:MAG TPA: hypothetical protein VH041_17410 [Caldimonas sp.]|nr:hypothetical protein [Caldimonas sp.]HEX4236067.1 hypothetical protein [Caldimonas sp.]
MGKHLVELVWDLPASFALPSLAACRRAVASVQRRAATWRSADGEISDPAAAARSVQLPRRVA